MLEWEVWLAPRQRTKGVSRRVTSDEMTWKGLQDYASQEGLGILVVIHPGGVIWGDGVYGQPDTAIPAGWTDDDTFADVLAEAKSRRRAWTRSR